MTLDLIELLSKASNVPFEDFGVHGSVALNMHSSKSDLDTVVYGEENFRKVEKAVSQLVHEGILSHQSNNRLDSARRFKGRFRGLTFMYTAIRKPHEINTKHGDRKFLPVKPVRFTAVVEDERESMFRPAIYGIRDYETTQQDENVSDCTIPSQVVSMIGCYRNVARKGDRIQVSGMLEKVENIRTQEEYRHVVVGTGTSEDEFICPP